MTRATLLKKLRALHGSRDAEMAHANADDLLIEFIGDKLVKEAFESVPRWYA